MQRLLREIFFISYIITFTLIYGNLIVLLMNKIVKERGILPPLQNKNNITKENINNLIVHYPTMLIIIDENERDILF
jgi:hypothetical protein